MNAPRAIAPIRRAEVEAFRSVVARRLGLWFEDGKLDHLADVLRRRLDALEYMKPEAYLERLAAEDASGEESRALATRLTVGETYFFRNPSHWRAFVELALPQRVRECGERRRLEFLSAGCASGEEPYSLAILLKEKLEGLSSREPSIRAIDLNGEAIRRATRGRYSAWSLRATPPGLQQRYFHRIGAEHELDEGVRKRVAFEERNLLDGDPALWAEGVYDVIFCRNVLMYFSPEAAREVVARFERSIAPGGFLFLGDAETLRGMSHEFHLRHTHDTFYYQRRGAAEHWTGPAPASGPPGAVADFSLEAAPAAGPEAILLPEAAASWVETIRQASQRIAALASGPAADPPGKAHSKRAPDPRARARADLGPAIEFLRQERFTDALALLRGLQASAPEDADALLLHAILLTNAGDLADAERMCRRLLAIEELNAGAHYLMALCREHAGDRAAAEEHDRIAVYLDPAFAMPRLHLGLLARRNGDPGTARRELSQAVALLAREDAARILFFGGGFSRESLERLCRAELQACGGKS